MNPRLAIIILASILTIGAVSAACVDVDAQNLDALIAETASIDSEIAACNPPPSLGPFRRIIGGNGPLVIDVTKSTGTETFNISRNAGTITGFSHGAASSCRQRVTMSEPTMNTILSSSDRVNSALWNFRTRDVQVNGCNFASRFSLFFIRPLAHVFLRSTVTSAPPPASSLTTGSGRPDGCEDTYLPGHRGYAENQALWDSYSANTDGVCQQNRGIPSGCEHSVQLSVSGTPYYLCWYDR